MSQLPTDGHMTKHIIGNRQFVARGLSSSLVCIYVCPTDIRWISAAAAGAATMSVGCVGWQWVDNARLVDGAAAMHASSEEERVSGI